MVSETTLARLAKSASALPTPADYFSGVRAPDAVRADNLLLFFRKSFADLHQSSLENQSHHRFVLLIALEGSATVNLDGVDLPLNPGHAVLVMPFQFHFFRREKDGPLGWLVLTFDSESTGTLEPLRGHATPLDDEELRRLGTLLTIYRTRDRAGAAGEIRLTAETLLQKLATHAAGAPRDTGRHPARGVAAWLPHINRRLHAGATSDGRIESLAKELGVSERLLRLRFSEHYGVSLGAYIHNFQLNNAAGMLSRSDLSLGEIARRCGYTSQAAFSRAFKARNDITPKDYRSLRRH